MTTKYEVAAGARFTKADAKVIGPELARIAKKHGEDNIASLDDKIILEEIKANKRSPLWQYLDSEEDAVEARWLEQCGHMRRGVRIVHVVVEHKPGGKTHTIALPAFKRVNPATVQRSSGKTVHKHVVIDRVLSDSSLLESCLSDEVKRLRNAAASLQQVVTCAKAPVPLHVHRLSEAVQAALADYERALAVGRDAAE